MEVYLPLGDVIDLEAERARLSKEADKIEGRARASERKLQNRDFTERAPAEVVDRERVRRDDLANQLAAVKKHIESLDEMA